MLGAGGLALNETDKTAVGGGTGEQIRKGQAVVNAIITIKRNGGTESDKGHFRSGRGGRPFRGGDI